MRRTLPLVLASAGLAVALTGCGDEQNAAGGGLPTITRQSDGSGSASAQNRTAAIHWCSLLRSGEGTTPDGKGRLPTGITRVTFRLYDTQRDVVCTVPKP